MERIYQPEAQGGNLLETSCHYDSGPGRWDKIELNQDGIILHARAEDVQGQLTVEISLFVTEGQVIRFVHPDVKLSLADASSSVGIGAISSYGLAGKRAEQESTAIMLGGKEVGNFRSKRAGVNSKKYSTLLKIPAHQGSTSFTLTLPTLQSDTHAINFPSIHFRPSLNARVVALCP